MALPSVLQLPTAKGEGQHLIFGALEPVCFVYHFVPGTLAYKCRPVCFSTTLARTGQEVHLGYGAPRSELLA